MRQIIVVFILLFLNGFSAISQADTITLCSIKLKAPTSCHMPKKNEVYCDDFQLLWDYCDENELQATAESFINQDKNQWEKFKAHPIQCLLLNQEVKGYKIIFEENGVTGYEIMAYGVINGQAVLVELFLTEYPKRNENIPDFAREIIRLKK